MCHGNGIKFEHFSSGFTDAVRRHQNASQGTSGHGGCLHVPSHHGGKTQHSSHGLRRRRRKSSATANLQQPRFVTPKGHCDRSSWTKMAEEQTDGAAASQTGFSSRGKVKEEDGGPSKAVHHHTFYIMFGDTDKNKHSIDCTGPKTVLTAIKTRGKYKSLGWSDQRIVIQMGKEDKGISIPTHFPCTCLKDEEILVVRKTSKEVEVTQTEEEILSKDEYSVFYIDGDGGKNTETKPFLKSNEFKKFKYLCVYGKKGVPEEEKSVWNTLVKDGRFNSTAISTVSSFTLTENDHPDTVFQGDDKIDHLQGKKLKIEFPWGEGAGKKKQPGTPKTTRQNKLKELVERSGFGLTTAEGESVFDLKELEKNLPEQFPDLREVMESRFPEDSFQKALNMRKEKFAEIQRSFSEVHTVRRLLERGKSVCQVVIEGVSRSRGTGFVLFDNFIMTNAHLFKQCLNNETRRLQEGTKVHVLFNYEESEGNTSKHYVQLCHTRKTEKELDYAILEIQPEGQNSGQTPSGQTEGPTQTEPIPPGLLEELGKMPNEGGLCIIGHPNGEVKKLDLTCIIEPEKREQAVSEKISKYRDLKVIFNIVDMLKKRGIEKITMGGKKAGNLGTYDTFMYHGSSGSPVFDAEGQVWGIHSAGFDYKVQSSTHSVIDFAYPLETIIKDYVKALIQEKNQVLLQRIEGEAVKNTVLKEVLESVRGEQSSSIKTEQPDSDGPD